MMSRRAVIAGAAVLPLSAAIPAMAESSDVASVLAPLAPKRIKTLYEIANEIMDALHPFPAAAYSVDPDEVTGNIVGRNRKEEPFDWGFCVTRMSIQDGRYIAEAKDSFKTLVMLTDGGYNSHDTSINAYAPLTVGTNEED